MTIGPLLLILGALDNVNIGRLAFFNTYGKVPLFYFLLHFFVIHIVALTAFIIKTGTSLSEIDFHFAKSFGGITPGIGHSLGGDVRCLDLYCADLIPCLQVVRPI